MRKVRDIISNLHNVFIVTETFNRKVMLDREVNNRRYTRGAALAVAQAEAVVYECLCGPRVRGRCGVSTGFPPISEGWRERLAEQARRPGTAQALMA